jgi:hypothetical protein
MSYTKPLSTTGEIVSPSKGLTQILKTSGILYDMIHLLKDSDESKELKDNPKMRHVIVRCYREILFITKFFNCSSASAVSDSMDARQKLTDMGASTDIDIINTNVSDERLILVYGIISEKMLSMTSEEGKDDICTMALIHDPTFIIFLERKIVEKIGDVNFKIKEFVSLWTYIIKPHSYSFFYLMLIKVLLKFKEYDMCEKIAKIMAKKCYDDPEIIEYIRSCIHDNLEDNRDYHENNETINSKFRLIRFPNYYIENYYRTGLDPNNDLYTPLNDGCGVT